MSQTPGTATDAAGRSYPAGLPKHSVSVGGAVIDDLGRFLAIKRRDSGEWVIPGGIIELDEDPIGALQREVLEETGLQVNPEVLTGVYKNMQLGVISLVFRCRVVGGVLQETEEASQTAWLTMEEAIGCMVEAFSIRLTDASKTEGPYIRVHDGVAVITDRRDIDM